MQVQKSVFWEVLRSWKARSVVFSTTGAAAYQFGCDQFGLPTLPKLWGMTGAGLPWWGWLVIAQTGFVYALFEYVRRLNGPNNSAIHFPYDDSFLKTEFSRLNQTVRSVIDDYQRMSALEARITDEIDRLKVAIQADGGKVTMHLQVMDRKIQDLSLIPAKLESVRVDGAIATRDIQKLESLQKAHREKTLSSLHAIFVRERLTEIATSMERDASDLYDRLRDGVNFDDESWSRWENVYSHWLGSLEEWLNSAQWYATSVRGRTNTVDENLYSANWTVDEKQFPNAEAVRRFKKHRIIRSNWLNVLPEVKNGVQLVAFSGMSEIEVRKGRPAE